MSRQLDLELLMAEPRWWDVPPEPWGTAAEPVRKPSDATDRESGDDRPLLEFDNAQGTSFPSAVTEGPPAVARTATTFSVGCAPSEQRSDGGSPTSGVTEGPPTGARTATTLSDGGAPSQQRSDGGSPTAGRESPAGIASVSSAAPVAIPGTPGSLTSDVTRAPLAVRRAATEYSDGDAPSEQRNDGESPFAVPAALLAHSARERADATDVRLYDDRDLPWIASIVDHAVDVIGQPWRVLRERLEHAPIGSARVAAILSALRRVLGGRAERVRIARRVRALVLGPPALDDATHQRRLAAAGAELGLDAEGIRDLLWIDLANERPVAMPEGRPSEHRLAAYANLDRIQRAVRRARRVRLRVWDEAHDLIRMATRCGLIANVQTDGQSTTLDVLGPLSLFHATSVYGRALAALVPLLADHPRFELVLDCDFGHGPASLRVLPPALLPPVPAERGKPSGAARLARQLAKLGVEVARDPQAIVEGREVLHPDLAIVHADRRRLVELVGFATAEYLTAKLARYTAAGADVVLCIDEKRAPAGPLDPRVFAYQRLGGASLIKFFEGLP